MSSPAGAAASLRAETLETRHSRYNVMSIVRVGTRIDLDVEGATYATWHPQQVFTGYSWDALSLGCLLRSEGPPRNVLVLGLGGGTVTRQLRALLPAVRLVGVEIDQDVVDLARGYLHLDDSGVEVHVGDAYDFLASTKESFDAIIDDLFLTGADDVFRARIPEGDGLTLLRSRVAPGGIVVANVITDVGAHATVRAQVRRAFRQAFTSVRILTPPRGLNEIIVGGDKTRAGSALSSWPKTLADAEDQRLVRLLRTAALRRRAL